VAARTLDPFGFAEVCCLTLLFVLSGLRESLAGSSAQMEALQVAYSKAQEELQVLEGAALAACKEIEGVEGSSGSSLVSRLASLGGRVVERLRGALRLGVQKTLGLASTHYLLDFNALTSGYIVAKGLDEDATVAAIRQADAAVDGPASMLAGSFEDDLFPDADEGGDDAAPLPPAP